VAEPLSLSLVMPAFNEEAGIERAVVRARSALQQAADDWEILVIDDGSTDRTGAIADSLATTDERVRVLHNERNVNYGVSLCRGLAAARCTWILHDGVDLPLAPEDLELFRPHFATADVIVATRRDREAHPPWRRVTSHVNRALLQLLFAPATRDLNFVQFYRRSFVQSLRPRSTSPAFLTPELILRAERTGARVVEVEATFRRRETGNGHFGRPKDILWTLRDMLSLRFHTSLAGWQR